jgi:tetratricopeptide (TPR) repeat protein
VWSGDPAQGLEYADRWVAAARRQPAANLVWPLRLREQAFFALGEFDRALADLDEAVAFLTARYGDEHPDLGTLEVDRTFVLDNAGKHEDAVAAGRRALSIVEATRGKEGRPAANACNALGAALNHAGRLEEGLVMLDRAVAIDRALNGARSAQVAADLGNRGDLLHALHRDDDALADFHEAESIFLAKSPNTFELGMTYGNEAAVLIDAGRDAAAGDPAERAIAICQSAPKNPCYGESLVALGAAQLAKHDTVRARESLAKGLDALPPDDATWRDRAQRYLARVAAAGAR